MANIPFTSNYTDLSSPANKLPAGVRGRIVIAWLPSPST